MVDMRHLAIALVACACSFRREAAMQAFRDAQLVADAPPDAAPEGPPPAPFAMAGARWLLPCTSGDLGNYNCNCAPSAIVQNVTLSGRASDQWSVSIRVRGVMEALRYGNGTATSGGWYIGGDTNGDNGDNYYELQISQPSAHFYLNDGTPTAQQSFLYDETETIVVAGDATLTFTANGQDGLQWGNYDASHTPITIAGVTSPAQPYDGQFAILDVLSATLL